MPEASSKAGRPRPKRDHVRSPTHQRTETIAVCTGGEADIRPAVSQGDNVKD